MSSAAVYVGRVVLRLLTWNLFHGRAVPPAGTRPGPRVHGRSARAGNGTWRCCRRCRRGGPPSLASELDADYRMVLTSRNALPGVRRAIAVRWPDLIKSNGGGCNAILVRRSAGWIAEHRGLRLGVRPERRWVHGVQAGAGCGSATCTPRRTPRAVRARGVDGGVVDGRAADRPRRRFQRARRWRWTGSRTPAAARSITCSCVDSRSCARPSRSSTTGCRITRRCWRRSGEPSALLPRPARRSRATPSRSSRSRTAAAGSYSIPSWMRLRVFVAGDLRREGERHVDPGRDAGGGDHLALLDDAARDRRGAVLGERVEHEPVRGRLEAVEDARRAEHERARCTPTWSTATSRAPLEATRASARRS